MSKNLDGNFPDAITKRDILHGRKKVTDTEKTGTGDGFMEAGWLSDAIDFLTTDTAKLEKIKTAAISEGNVFLLLKLYRVTGKENPSELTAAAQKAEELGKFRYALRAYEKLGDTEKVAALKTQLADQGDMRAEANSVFIPKSEEERADEGDEE